MRTFVSSTLAAAILAASSLAAQAVTVSLNDTITQPGDTLSYSFTGLPTLAAGGGKLTLFTTGTGVNGIDLGSNSAEYMDVDADGLSLGRWECGEANDGGQLIPGHSSTSDCLFSFVIDIAAADFAPIIADGTVTVSLIMGTAVAFFSGERDEIGVTLEYTPAVAPIPLPASLPLLAAGVGGLVLLRRRRRA